MNIKNLKNNNTVIAILMIVLGIFLGWMIFGGSGAVNQQHNHGETASQGEATTYTCSMHPQIRQPEPGKCPICGMELIPVSDASSEQNMEMDPATVQMSETAMKLANIQTSEVRFAKPVKTIDLTGKVTVDTRRVYSQPVHFPGRIEQLYVNFEGERIRKGQKIAEVYSPALISAQRELHEAKAMEGANNSLIEAARKKLELWKLSEDQIDELQNSDEIKTTFTLRSDISGILYKRKINPGDYINKGSVLFTVANLNRVWVNFDAYESDLPWLREGDSVSFTVPSIPGETFAGKINFIDPVLNNHSRSVTIRTSVRNYNGLLKPEMFANGKVKASLPGQEEVIIVPKSAVMWTGKRSVVFTKTVMASQTGFKMREVTLGPSLGDAFVIKEGLQKGESVVTNGAFSVDASAQLAGKPSMMNKNPQVGEKVQSGHDHGQMAMDNSSSGNKENGSQSNKQKLEPGTQFKAQLKKIVESYLGVKDALVAGVQGDAAKNANELLQNIDGVDMGNMDSSVHDKWMKIAPKIKENAIAIAKSKNIEEQRSAFIQLSELMTNAAEQFTLDFSALYVQFCPMANDNKGAIWLSLEKPIKNPYYGEQMLTCGSTKRNLIE